MALSAAECEAVLLALVQLRQVPLALSTFQARDRSADTTFVYLLCG